MRCKEAEKQQPSSKTILFCGGFFSNQLLMQPFAAAVTQNVRDGTEYPVDPHAGKYAQQSHGREQGVEQEAQTYPEGKHGDDGQDHGIADISCGPEGAHRYKGEGIQREDRA